MQFQTHAQAEIPVVMSQRFGSISATRAQLQHAFGVPMPHQHDDYVTTEWRIVFADGTIASIYDFRHPTGKPMPDEVLSWSVGGYSRQAVERVHQAFREANAQRIDEALRIRAQRLKEKSRNPRMFGQFAE